MLGVPGTGALYTALAIHFILGAQPEFSKVFRLGLAGATRLVKLRQPLVVGSTFKAMQALATPYFWVPLQIGTDSVDWEVFPLKLAEYLGPA